MSDKIMLNGRQIVGITDLSLSSSFACCKKCLGRRENVCSELPTCGGREYFVYYLNQKVFKIRRKSDGKFSTGGARPSFTKEGKSWSTLGRLKSSVTLSKTYQNTTYDNAGCFEVVEYHLVEESVTTLD